MPSLSSNGSQKNLRVEIIFPACLFLPAASPDPIPASLSITGAVKPSSDSLPRFSPLQPPNPTFNPKTKKKKKEIEKEGEKRRGREKKKTRKEGREGGKERRKLETAGRRCLSRREGRYFGYHFQQRTKCCPARMAI